MRRGSTALAAYTVFVDIIEATVLSKGGLPFFIAKRSGSGKHALANRRLRIPAAAPGAADSSARPA
jgi:hypothetical protein